MASGISAHQPGTPPAPGIKEVVEKSSFALPWHNSATNTPPNTPIAKSSSLGVTAALEVTEKTPAVPCARIPYTSARSVESDTDLGDGEILEHVPPTISDADSVVNTSFTIYEGFQDEPVTEQKRAIECAKQDDPAAADLTTADEILHTVTPELHEPRSERAIATEFGDFPSAPAITLMADPHEEGEGKESDQNHDRSHIDDVETKNLIARQSENESFGGDEDVAAESQKHNAGAAPSQSKPPHMRPTFKAPNIQQSSTVDTRVSRYSFGFRQDRTNLR